MKLTVGQKLCFVPNRKYMSPRFVTVAKIGRKWVTAAENSTLRFDKDTMQADGYWTGSAYQSYEHYEETKAITQAWTDFCDKMKWYNQPDGVTVEKIAEARKLLGLDAA